MRIFCDDTSIFNSRHQPSYRQLAKCFVRASEGQHTLIIVNIEEILRSDFFAKAVAPMDQLEWEELVIRATLASDVEDRAQEPGSRPQGVHAYLGSRRVPTDNACCFALTPLDIGEWAEAPLCLLLENDRDWSLLEAAARAYGAHRIEDSFLRRWLVVDGRGGSGEVLNSLRGRGANDRFFVFIDSDRPARGGPLSPTAEAIKIECQRVPWVPCRITRKREIENYIPRSVLEARVYGLKQRRSWAGEAQRGRLALVGWLKLTDEERCFDDLKARFGEGVTRAALADLQNPRKCGADDLKNDDDGELGEILREIEAYL
jgi:hypothetical protein